MKKCYCIFNSYIKGAASLVIICILPLISPLISFIKKDCTVLPYVMILVANVGVIYKFFPLKGDNAVKRIKVERFLIIFLATIFIALTIFRLFYVIEFEKNQSVTWVNYVLLAYVLTPLIVTVIEIFYSFYLEIKDDNEYGNNKIANGIALEV